MKLGILTNVVCNLSLVDALSYFKKLGLDAVEIGCGGTPGVHHCDPDILLRDEKKFEAFRQSIQASGLSISAFSCHGNPVHPIPEIAQRYDHIMRNAVLMAEKMGVDTICCFSGCPGSEKNAKYPHWTTTVWPFDAVAANHYQWDKVLIPYWKKFTAFAREHHVTKIAIEMHPGFCVYNAETLLKLLAAVGPVIGANFDPSHLIWQGVDPVAAIRALAGAIYHVHAKDTKIDRYNTAVNGVLDTKHYSDELHRSWVFRTVGYGNGETYWRDLVSNLRLCGYDRVLSIEHEDSVMTIDEGLRKAVDFLNKVIITEEKPTTMSWA